MTTLLLNCWSPEGEDLGPRRVILGEGAPAIGAAEAGEPEGHLVPGFVDLHIHGGHGVDFMTATREDMVGLCEWLKGEGYDSWLPTTITASAPDVKKALASLPDHPMIEGFHLEGPFISPVFPGAQPPSAIRPPSEAHGEWDEILDDPRLRVITMAPEEPGGLALVRRLSGRGVRVSMGHTNASHAEALAAIEAGACQATHTYNAMRGLHHREPGTVGAVLGEGRVLAELIYDRVHVHPGAAKALLAAKGLHGVTAISDGTMASGMAPGTEFEVWGHKMITAEGEVRLKSNGALAGSAITLKQAFQNLAQDFGIEAAVRLCSANPRRALGISRPPRSYVQFDPAFRFAAVWPC